MKPSKKMLSNREIASFCAQMAMILRSGISPLEGVEILAGDTDRSAAALFHQLQDSLHEGCALNEAMDAAGVFPAYACDMTRIGLQSGCTDEIMEALAQHYERENAIAARFKSAVAYPSVMLCMMAAVILLLIVKVLPLFNQVYRQLGSELTGLSRSLMELGTLIARYGFFLTLLLVALAVFVFFLFALPRGRALRRQIGAKIGPIRRLQEKIAAGRFADGLAICLSSGLSIEESITLAGSLVNLPSMQEKLLQCREFFLAGASFADAMQDAGVFSGLHARMLSVGYRTGATEQVLRKIARQYEEETDEKISHLISILEPTMVAVLSCVVGLILLSVMLPLLGIMSNAGLS